MRERERESEEKGEERKRKKKKKRISLPPCENPRKKKIPPAL